MSTSNKSIKHAILFRFLLRCGLRHTFDYIRKALVLNECWLNNKSLSHEGKLLISFDLYLFKNLCLHWFNFIWFKVNCMFYFLCHETFKLSFLLCMLFFFELDANWLFVWNFTFWSFTVFKKMRSWYCSWWLDVERYLWYLLFRWNSFFLVHLFITLIIIIILINKFKFLVFLVQT